VSLSANAALREGRLALKAGNLDIAVEHFTDAISRAPRTALPWVLKAEVLYQLGRVREAVAAATRAVQLDDGATPAWVRLGAAALRLGDRDEAARNFERALDIDLLRAHEWHRRLRGAGGAEQTKDSSQHETLPPTPQLRFASVGRRLCLEEQSGEGEIQQRRVRQEHTPPLWDVGYFIRGRYEVLAVRRGGMSFVHICFDHSQGRPYAIKTLKPDLLEAAAVRDAFLREAELWVQLERHPHIVEADFVQVIDSQPVIFLEYIDGGSLSGLLRERALSITQAIELALQVADALEHAHTQGKIIHQDVKPSNVLLTAGGLAKVTDFGLAQAVGAARGSQTGDERYVFGTPQYMAPEQFVPEGDIDARVDVYSFGCTLYEMLTRRWPFEGSTAAEYRDAHTKAPIPDPRTLNTAIRPALAEVVGRCMQKAPEDRFRAFAEVSAALGGIYREMTGKQPERAAALDQFNAAHWAAKGASLAQLGKHEEALEAFDRAIQIDQELPQGWVGKANSLHVLGRHREAIVCCYRTLAREPKSIAAYNIRGLSQAALGEHKQAIQDFQRAVETNANNREAWHNMGLSLEALGDYDRAIECFDRALAIEPNTAQSWLSKALCLLAKGDYRSAAQSCDRLLEMDPEAADAWKVKGASLAALGKWERAMTCYDRALELDPEDEYARQAAEEVERKRSAPTQKENKREPSHFDRGLRRMQKGRFAEAAAEFERAVEADPGDEKSWRHLSAAYFQVGRYAEAERPARRSVELAPHDPAVHCNLGVIQRKQQKWSEARESLLHALRLDPDYLKAREELDKVNTRDPAVGGGPQSKP
jgi:tetratricopeptide (TPR) repeat protein